jgi:hypothetical protein
MTMKSPKQWQNIIVAMAMLALTIPAIGFAAGADNANPRVLPTKSTPYGGTVPVPFKGSWTGETYILGYCPDGRLHYIDVSPRGHMTHLGKATWLADVCLDLSVFPAYGTGTGVVTAANGDEIHMALTIEVNTLDWTWKETEHYAGGTGRFVDAVGQTVSLGSIAWESQIHGFWSCHTTGSLTF